MCVCVRRRRLGGSVRGRQFLLYIFVWSTISTTNWNIKASASDYYLCMRLLARFLFISPRKMLYLFIAINSNSSVVTKSAVGRPTAMHRYPGWLFDNWVNNHRPVVVANWLPLGFPYRKFWSGGILIAPFYFRWVFSLSCGYCFLMIVIRGSGETRKAVSTDCLFVSFNQ